MHHTSLLLDFAPRTIDDLMITKVQSNHKYSQLKLKYANDGLWVDCKLPTDAQVNDTITLSASKEEARHACFYGEKRITQFDINNKFLRLKLTGQGHSDNYLLQLNLLGMNDIIKNSAEFSAKIKNTHTHKKAKNLNSPWLRSAKAHSLKLMSLLRSRF